MRYLALIVGLSACSAGAPSPGAPSGVADLPGALWVQRPPPPPLGVARRIGGLWVGAVPREDGRFDEIVALEAGSYAPLWRYRFNWSAISLPWAVGSPGVLVMQLQSNEKTLMIAFDPRSGGVLWSEDDYAYEALMVQGVLVLDHARALRGRRAVDGSPLWKRSATSNVHLASERWLVSGNDEGIDVLDPQSGETRRHMPIAAPSHQANLAIEGDTLYVSRWGEGMSMLAADLATGMVSWKSQVLDTPLAIGAPVLGGQRVFGCTTSNVIIGWDKRTGDRRFTRGVIGCAGFTVRPGPPEELSLSENSYGPILQFEAASTTADAKPACVEGTVTDDRGQPVADAEIAVGLSTAHSDSRGHYRVDVGYPGTVCASANKGDHAAPRTCIQPSSARASRLDLLLERLRADHDDD